MCEGIPSKSSPYADEGTEAHALAEAILTKSPVARRADTEMMGHIQVYLDEIENISSEGCKLFIETRVQATPEVWGTADAIVWDPHTATLYVRDLKYGAGVGVEVSDNLQLKIYALAALITMGFPAKTINVGIVQPRFHHPDGPCRSKDYDSVDLLEFWEDLKDAVKRVYETNPALNATEKGCRWCLAAPTCPKITSRGNELAKEVFKVGLHYDLKQLSETLDFLPILEGWIKNVREFAYAEAEKGVEIPDYKLVDKRASRKWLPIEQVSPILEAYISPEDLYRPLELRTLGDIEKMLPKDKISILNELTVKESSGRALVHQSDKRDTVRTNAKAAFTLTTIQ